jgi:hypothetical protein
MAVTEKDFIDAGYRRFNTYGHKSADFGLQKLISDDHGKKYYITVYAYDLRSFEHSHKDFSFMPDVQFRINARTDKEHFVDVSMGLGAQTSIDVIEALYEGLWLHFGCPYYDRWDE